MKKFKGVQIADYKKSTVNYFNLKEIETMKNDPDKYSMIKRAIDTGEAIFCDSVCYFAMDTNYINCSHCNGSGKINVLSR